MKPISIIYVKRIWFHTKNYSYFSILTQRILSILASHILPINLASFSCLPEDFGITITGLQYRGAPERAPPLAFSTHCPFYDS
jgi:hypothetical protein